MTNFKVRTLVAAVATAAIGFGFAAQASAAQTFTINPGAIGVNIGTENNNFTADKIDFSTSELLTLNSDLTATGSGYGIATSFDLASQPVFSGLKPNPNGYNIYFTFNLKDVYNAAQSTGGPGQANSVYDLVSLDFTFYADPNGNTTFQQAHANPNPTEAMVGGITSDDIVLATGTLLGGTAGFNNQGGAFLNANNTFDVCTGAGTASRGGVAVGAAACTNAVGLSFFAQPVPFYNLVISEFNNTRSGLDINGNKIAITQATGAVDFAGTSVPEPASLMLLGVGLLGLGASVRGRKSKA